MQHGSQYSLFHHFPIQVKPSICDFIFLNNGCDVVADDIKNAGFCAVFD